MQPVESPCLLPPVQTAPARLPRAEVQLQRQELPGYVVVEDEQDALQTKSVRHRLRPRRPLRPRRQHRLDQRPQLIVHDPRSSTHTLTNGRIITLVTANQDVSARSCYDLLGPTADYAGMLPTPGQNSLWWDMKSGVRLRRDAASVPLQLGPFPVGHQHHWTGRSNKSATSPLRQRLPAQYRIRCLYRCHPLTACERFSAGRAPPRGLASPGADSRSEPFWRSL